MAGYVIHTADGLAPQQLERALELGPAQGHFGQPLPKFVRAAGLTPLSVSDVTPAFRRTNADLFDVRREHEAALRAEEGDELYEESQERRVQTLTAVDEGLLLRSLVVAERA
jgi:hypothetical protein